MVSASCSSGVSDRSGPELNSNCQLKTFGGYSSGTMSFQITKQWNTVPSIHLLHWVTKRDQSTFIRHILIPESPPIWPEF